MLDFVLDHLKAMVVEHGMYHDKALLNLEKKNIFNAGFTCRLMIAEESN